MKKIISTIVIFILIMSSSIISNAAQDFKLNLTSDFGTVDVGSNITMTLELESIKDGNPLVILDGKLEYDTEIFELVEFKGTETWDIQFDSENKKFSILLAEDEEFTSGEIGKIVLKAKKKPESGEAQITVKELKTIIGEGESTHDDLSYSININEKVVIKTQEDSNMQNNKEAQSNKEIQSNVMDNKTKKVQSKNNLVTVLNIAIIILLVLSLIIGIIIVIKHIKEKNNK